MAPPRLEALGLTAAGMDALGLYAALLAVVDAKELVAGHVTVGLVQELAGLVHLKVNRWDTVPPSKLSVKEFCHVVVKLRSKEFAEPLLKRKRGAHAVPQHSGITDPQHSSTTVTEPRHAVARRTRTRRRRACWSPPASASSLVKSEALQGPSDLVPLCRKSYQSSLSEGLG